MRLKVTGKRSTPSAAVTVAMACEPGAPAGEWQVGTRVSCEQQHNSWPTTPLQGTLWAMQGMLLVHSTPAMTIHMATGAPTAPAQLLLRACANDVRVGRGDTRIQERVVRLDLDPVQAVCQVIDVEGDRVGCELVVASLIDPNVGRANQLGIRVAFGVAHGGVADAIERVRVVLCSGRGVVGRFGRSVAAGRWQRPTADSHRPGFAVTATNWHHNLRLCRGRGSTHPHCRCQGRQTGL